MKLFNLSISTADIWWNLKYFYTILIFFNKSDNCTSRIKRFLLFIIIVFGMSKESKSSLRGSLTFSTARDLKILACTNLKNLCTALKFVFFFLFSWKCLYVLFVLDIVELVSREEQFCWNFCRICFLHTPCIG